MNNNVLIDKENYFAYTLIKGTPDYEALNQVRSQYSLTYSYNEAMNATIEQLINFYKNNMLENDGNCFRSQAMQKIIDKFDDFAKTRSIIEYNFLAAYKNLKISGIKKNDFIKEVLNFYYAFVGNSETKSIEEWVKKYIDFTNIIDKSKNIKYQENEIRINNQNDYKKIESFAKSFTKNQLEEIQSILIEAENDPQYLSDVVSAFDKVYVQCNEKDNSDYNLIISKLSSDNIVVALLESDNNYCVAYNYNTDINSCGNGYYFNKNDNFALNYALEKFNKYFIEYSNDYDVVKVNDQIDFLKGLIEGGLEDYEYLSRLNENELKKFVIESKNLEEEFACNDELPTFAVIETIKSWKQRVKDIKDIKVELNNVNDLNKNPKNNTKNNNKKIN